MALSRKGIQVEEAENISIDNYLLFPPYQGQREIHIANSLKRYANKILVQKEQTAYTEKQSSSCFKTKDNTQFSNNMV